MSENHLITDRKEKIKNWEAKGFSGYAKKFDRTHTATQAKETVNSHDSLREPSDLMKNEVKPQNALCGRLMQMRDMGKLAFLRIRDVSGDFQICLAKNVLGEDYKWFVKNLDLGDFCGFAGEFFLTKHGEPSLMAVAVTPLSKALRPLPEKFHGLTDTEGCYRERNLDLITNPDTFNRFKIRSEIVREIRNFFHEKDFLEVETGILQAQAGGAMAKVFETHHNALDHDFVLRIALELDLKRACSGGFERVFEIGKNFRNEGSDPSHLQEFTMLEWYAAYQDIDTNKKWTQEMIQTVMMKVLGTTKATILDKDEKEVGIDFGGEFTEVRFPDLLKKYADLDMFTASDEEVRTKAKEVGVEQIDGVGRANLLDDIYKKTARPNIVQPTFVMDYPEDLKPLAMPNGDGTASCFQLLVGGWEIVNAYGELIDPMVQRSLLEKQSAAKEGGDDEAMELDEVFLKAMEHGFPPMTGNGIGIDRFVSLITTQSNLRDVVLFPIMRPEQSKEKYDDTQVSVAILNEDAKLENWQKLNAIAHLTAALGAREGKKMFFQDELTTKDNAKIKLNTEHAIIIKSALSDKDLKKLITTANENELGIAEFTRGMLETSDDKKLVAEARSKNYSEIEHLGVLVFGKKSVVEKLTKGFELMK